MTVQCTRDQYAWRAQRIQPHAPADKTCAPAALAQDNGNYTVSLWPGQTLAKFASDRSLDSYGFMRGLIGPTPCNRNDPSAEVDCDPALKGPGPWYFSSPHGLHSEFGPVIARRVIMGRRRRGHSDKQGPGGWRLQPLQRTVLIGGVNVIFSVEFVGLRVRPTLQSIVCMPLDASTVFASVLLNIRCQYTVAGPCVVLVLPSQVGMVKDA